MQNSSRTPTSSARPGTSPLPGSTSTQVNTQTKVIDTVSGRILCIADVRGRLSSLNDMAREANAKAIIHTGDFGFFEASSLERINDRTLKHLTQYSPLIPNAQRSSLLAPDTPASAIRAAMSISLLSEFPLLLSGQLKLSVPVYTVWGACEDVFVLEKFRQGTYDIENLHILDEATTRCLDIGGVKLRLLGLGGAFVPHKMFDNGDGNATIAGGQGTMWTTALQIGELVDTAQRVYDPSETRLLVTHASPGREGIITQLALVLKADLTLSAGLHFRYTTSWNEFSVQGDFEGFRHKILNGKDSFTKIWESVKPQVEAVVDENQRILLDKALSVIERIPAGQPHIGPGGTATGDEPAWKNCWNWNLCDAAYGSLVLDIKEGRVSAELKSQGFNYAYRRTANSVATPNSTAAALPNSSNNQSSINALSHRSLTPNPNIKANPADPSTSDTNGAGPDNQEGDKQKFRREKKKDKKDVKETEELNGAPEYRPGTVSPSSTPLSGKVTPISNGPETSATNTVGEQAEDGSGAQTPTTRRSKNPWSLFMRIYNPNVTETEVRDFFNEAKDNIIRVTFPSKQSASHNRYRTAFVDFPDEPSMRLALEKHSEKLKGAEVQVSQAEDREFSHSGPFRGRGRGRGGGFAARGFAAAGLTRQQQDRKASGEVSSPREGQRDN
ncbi:Ser Thr phosphatase [Pyrrhoderma noxium]|uniref:Ser Thr phosphatase n=1 Tax=Pyrrhoderma noxium TaxID=2282107 RepID=A0A286ULY4_9AGAM|nr:Ser Thr phosphatase [Pyrrhoderma noxium]